MIYDGENVWFTSDLHFGHKKLALLRGFDAVEEHDAGVVERLNASLTDNTTLYILGDLSFHKPKDTADILASIKGKKVLIKGNHDHRTRNAEGAELPVHVRVELSEFHHYLERTFKVWKIRGGDLTYDEHTIVMFHFPMMHWRGQDKGWIQFHGHLHGSDSGVPGRCIDVGYDNWFVAKSLQSLVRYAEDLPVRANHHEGVGFRTYEGDLR